MAANGYPKHHRLLDAADYQAVLRKSTLKVSCRYFLILAIDNDLPVSRLGLVVSKRNVAGAVQRNRIKRQIRECFRHHAPGHGLDMVVLVRKGADGLANGDIAGKLEQLLVDLAGKCES
ncbi:MAG: ribonuclease P protein component [Pseudohongiellaceae bacterium]